MARRSNVRPASSSADVRDADGDCGHAIDCTECGHGGAGGDSSNHDDDVAMIHVVHELTCTQTTRRKSS